MKIMLNGKEVCITESVSIKDLLEQRSIQLENIVVEINNTIIQRDKYPTILITNGDTIEVLHIVGGG